MALGYDKRFYQNSKFNNIISDDATIRTQCNY